MKEMGLKGPHASTEVPPDPPMQCLILDGPMCVDVVVYPPKVSCHFVWLIIRLAIPAPNLCHVF